MGTATRKSIFEENAPKLVGWYIKKHQNLIRYFGSYEDMHQHLLCEAWKATLKYNKDIARYTTYIFVCIKNAAGIYVRKANALRRKGVLISTDDLITNTLSLNDMLADDSDVFEEYQDKQCLKIILANLKPEAYDYYINELKQQEVAVKHHTSQANVSRRIRKNIEEIKTLFL